MILTLDRSRSSHARILLSITFCGSGPPCISVRFTHACDAVASLRQSGHLQSANDIIVVVSGIKWGWGGVWQREGAQEHPHQTEGPYWLLRGVLWSPTPPETNHHKHQKPRQRPESAGPRLSLPGVGALFRLRDVRRRCDERCDEPSEAAVSASLSRVLSARETAGEHGAGEGEVGSGWSGVGTLCGANPVQRESRWAGRWAGAPTWMWGCGCGDCDGRVGVSTHCVVIASSRSLSTGWKWNICGALCSSAASASQAAAAGGLVPVWMWGELDLVQCHPGSHIWATSAGGSDRRALRGRILSHWDVLSLKSGVYVNLWTPLKCFWKSVCDVNPPTSSAALNKSCHSLQLLLFPLNLSESPEF